MSRSISAFLLVVLALGGSCYAAGYGVVESKPGTCPRDKHPAAIAYRGEGPCLAYVTQRNGRSVARLDGQERPNYDCVAWLGPTFRGGSVAEYTAAKAGFLGAVTQILTGEAEARGHYEAGVAAKAAKDYQKAEVELKQAVELYPEYLDAHWALAWVYNLQQQNWLATGHFLQVIRLAPDADKAREAAEALKRMEVGGTITPQLPPDWPAYLEKAKLPPGLLVRVAAKDRMPQVFIAAGEFMMGASGDPPAPGHRVAVDAFWMDLHEVTYDQLCAFLNDAKPDRALRLTWLALGGEPEKEFNTGFAYGPKVVREEDGRFTVAPGFEQYPVAWVSHVGAEAYAAWAGRKLPTDAQWELAARAGKEGQSYHWGQDPSPPPGVGNLADESLTNIWPQLFGYKGYNDGFVVASPVCSFPPNAFGLLDMEGNMAEWCGTAHERGGYVIRGGLYNGNQSDYRLDSRRSEKEDFVWDTTGFRCAAPVE